jgi:hypothetical protein
MCTSETFAARGHPNIRAIHRTTLMITTERNLTTRGDCVVAVASEKGPRDLSPSTREAIRRRDAKIRVAMEVNGLVFDVSGKGDPGLTLSHPTDMVIRKSGYTCDRTLMICADRAACDIPKEIVRMLRNGDQTVNISLFVETG